jgi:hypothetical protein
MSGPSVAGLLLPKGLGNSNNSGGNSGASSSSTSAAASPKRGGGGGSSVPTTTGATTSAAARSLGAPSSSTASANGTGTTPRAGRRSSSITGGGKGGKDAAATVAVEEVKETPAIEPRDEVLEDLLKTRLEDGITHSVPLSTVIIVGCVSFHFNCLIVALRSQKFAREIERLRAEARKREHDTTDMIKYLEQDVKRKEMDHKTLSKQVRDTHELYLQEKGMLKRHYEGLLKRQEGVFLVKEQQLLDKNKQLMEEVPSLPIISLQIMANHNVCYYGMI